MNTIHISTYAFNKVRITARKLKSSHPELTHKQRLDLASQEVLNKRHYHEVKKLHDKYVSETSLPEEYMGSNYVHTCSYCRMQFCHDLEEDVLLHKAHHNEWEKAEFYLNYSPLDYNGCEALKEKAYKKLGVPKGKSDEMAGTLAMVKAHFDRSLENAIFNGYWKNHPSFEKYIAMYDFHEIFPVSAVKELHSQFGVIEGEIPKGRSYWFPKEE